MCLDTTGESVPAEAFAWAVRVAEARQDGEPADEVEAMYPEEALAWRCWTAALDARASGADASTRRCAHHHQRGPQ